MATRPKSVKLKNDSAAITNAIMNEVAKSYPATPIIRVPEDKTKQLAALQQIGNAAALDMDFANAFFKTLVNRIVLVIYQNMYFENPWKRFKRGFLEAGDVVEEIAFDLCNVYNYDSTEDREYPKQEIQEPYVAFHKLNYQKYYKKTVNRDRLLQAFLTRTGMEEFTQELLRTMYVSAENDEYLAMKYMVGRNALNNFMLFQNIPEINKDNMDDIATLIKGISNDMTILTTEYNAMRLPTSTQKRNQIILINTHFDARLDVEVLAVAFNMDKADIEGQRVFINAYSMADVSRMDEIFKGEENYQKFTTEELTKLNSIPLFILDDRFFMIFDYLMEMTEFFNPEKLYWNYWLHTWKILSCSNFVNAIAFTTMSTGAEAVTITPSTVTTAAGSSVQFNAAVTGSGFLPTNISWSVAGQNSPDTTISNLGLLTVGTDETAETLTVTATTNAATSGQYVNGSATVTITKVAG